MANHPLSTFFAPAERSDTQVLQFQKEKVADNSLVRVLLGGFPEGAVVLNSLRQIVHANDNVASFLATSSDALIGLRLGEAVGCIHAHDPPAGCGTTEFCQFCGAAQATESSRLNHSKEVRECRILRAGHAACPALDLRVTATPVKLDGEPFTILALRDISAEKRRELLERIFFHDVINLAGGLHGVLQHMPELSDAEARALKHLATLQAEQLIEEIECHRDLTAAERGDLEVHPRPVAVRELLNRLCFLYGHHPVGEGKVLTVEVEAGDTLTTDPVLLRRVLGNLIKNALEASQRGETVSVRFTSGPQGHVFAVHNPAVMEEAVQAQMFQRSFSTKGKGRGLGSYSVKLLTERYLQGCVEFDSVVGSGTTFRVTLPAHLPCPSAPLFRSPSAQADSVEENARALAGLRILLAEDSAVNRLLVKEMLEKYGMDVLVVSNGKEAVEAVQTQMFDALLMDAEMPELDGLEATAAIRARERETGGHVPIIALTAHTSEEDHRRCLAVGMDEHLTKPVKKGALLAALVRQTRGRTHQVAAPTPKAEAAAAAPALDPAALARLRALTDSTPGMLSEVVTAFLHDTVSRLETLEKALAAGDAEQLHKCAHGLKGAAAELGARDMTRLCRELESLGRAGSVVGAAELLVRLKQEFSRVCTEARALVQGEAS